MSHEQFINLDEESRQRRDLNADETKRIRFLEQYDGIGLDAISFLLKCLQKLPRCSADQFDSHRKGHMSSTMKTKTPLRSTFGRKFREEEGLIDGPDDAPGVTAFRGDDSYRYAFGSGEQIVDL